MSITIRTIADDSTQATRHIVVDYTFHTGEILRKRFSIGLVDDAMTEAIAHDQEVLDEMARREVGAGLSLAEQGLSPEITVKHQPQADYDRRILGNMMLEINSHVFFAAYTFFQAVEGRGGSNANARASYLGIVKAVYDDIAARFSNVTGVAWILTDERNKVWTELTEVFY